MEKYLLVGWAMPTLLFLALFVFSDRKLADILQDKQQQGIKIKALIAR